MTRKPEVEEIPVQVNIQYVVESRPLDPEPSGQQIQDIVEPRASFEKPRVPPGERLLAATPPWRIIVAYAMQAPVIFG